MRSILEKARKLAISGARFSRQENASAGSERVAMLHTGRCGSTVLGKMLDDHSLIHWSSELFEDMSSRHKEYFGQPDAVEKILKSDIRLCKKKFYGFETKYLPQQHLRADWINMGLAQYLSFLRNQGFSRFIILHRRNHLRRAISAYKGMRRNEWHVKRVQTSCSKINIDTRSFLTGNETGPLIELFRLIDKTHKELKNLLSSDTVLNLHYEDDIQENPETAYHKVCDFLGVKRQKPIIQFEKTNPFRIVDMLDNYNEITQLLIGTEYEWMLDD